MTVTAKTATVAIAALCAVALTACGGAKTSGGNARTVNVGVDDAGCTPADLKLTAGPKRFVVKSTGSGKVTEYEILDNGKIIGEREGVTPGIDGEFNVTLPPGRFVTYCPGGSRERGTLTVTAPAGYTGATSATPIRKTAADADD